METTHVYKVRRGFLVPFGLLLVLLLTLLVVTLVQSQPREKILLLVVIILPVAILFVESLFRKTEVGADEVTAHKLLRDKTLRFAEITHVDLVKVRKRAFLTLSSEEDFLILSNAYADFPKLVTDMLPRLPEAAITPEFRAAAEDLPVKSSDIVSCWIAVALVLFILYVQLGGPLLH